MRGILIVASLCASLLFAGCAARKEEKQEATRFLVTTPLKKDTLTVKQYVCQIRAIQHIEVRALERGYLEKIFVDEGHFVRKGQPMFQIMPALYQAELQKAEAEASFASIEYENTRTLADSNVVSKNELALAKAKLDQARASVLLAETHLGFTQIKAPFSGIMDRFFARQGSLLDEGDLLTILADNSSIWVYFNVPEAEYLDYKSNVAADSVLRVELLMANNKLFGHPGVVETIEADFNHETGNIAFRATFKNPDGLLRHGETGSILMPVKFDDALIIPQKATFEILEKKYVFVVDKDNVLHQREINIAAELPDIYIIQDGLKESDRILLEGLRKVRDLQEIAYEFEEPAQVLTKLNVYTE